MTAPCTGYHMAFVVDRVAEALCLLRILSC